ncbi:uncharacterized protein LOC121677030 [Arvicola amphibius]|uniref:uncharacterized protein LOC121677030 n=1 Tax=Arvicola amphibius TaxID=1047088 RepID=UPI001C08C1B1|nr:uncharacterized protein LOC121677030 [Arvicola amphibius]
MPATSHNRRIVAGLAWLGLGSVVAREHVRGGVKLGARAGWLLRPGTREEEEFSGAVGERAGGEGERELQNKWLEVEAEHLNQVYGQHIASYLVTTWANLLSELRVEGGRGGRDQVGGGSTAAPASLRKFPCTKLLGSPGPTLLAFPGPAAATSAVTTAKRCLPSPAAAPVPCSRRWTMDPTSIYRKDRWLAERQAELCQAEPEMMAKLSWGTRLGVLAEQTLQLVQQEI